MMKELWVPVSGAIAQQKLVDTIANNIANANTPGFKKDNQIFQEYLASFNQNNSEDVRMPQKEWKPEDFYRTFGAENGHVKSAGTYTIHEQGQLVPTQNPLDLGLNGKGFFEVLGPQGVRYTRKGQFSLSQEGYIVNDSGDFLLSKLTANADENRPLNSETGTGGSENAEGGEAQTKPQARLIKIGELQGQLHINQVGEIFQGANKIADISVVEFKDVQELTKEGGLRYINRDENNILGSDQTKTTILQGFVENSNVNAIQEMSSLIRANRHFEAIQKAIKAYDNLAEKSVTEIGKF
jgi:flagellar basal-body rod protein FlgF